MKSAYELAMERLRSEEPDHQPLTDTQKEQLSEVETVYKAKMAGRDIFLRGQLEKARLHGDLKEIDETQKQIRYERDRLEQELETKKNEIRNTKS